MQRWKDIKIDDPSMWPTDHIVEMEKPFVDKRGSIQLLANLPMKNVTLITSVKGALRANHYHRTDWHFMYMISGSSDYYYRPTGSNEEPQIVRWNQGELIFTPPMEDHTTIFLEDSVFLAMSRNPRDQEAYESDVVRVNLVDPSNHIV